MGAINAVYTGLDCWQVNRFASTESLSVGN